MSASLISFIGGELEQLLEPITLAVEDTGWRSRFLMLLGINTDVNTASLLSALTAVLDLKQQLTNLASNDSPSFDEIAGVLNAASTVFNAVRAIESGSGLGAAFENLADDLVQALVTSHLSNTHPFFYSIMKLLTVVEPAETAARTTEVIEGDAVLRLPMALDRIHPKRIVDLLRDPIATLKTEYVNALATVDDASALADKLFPRLSDLLTELGVANKYGLSESSRDAFGDAALLLDHSLFIYLAEKVQGAPVDVGFSLAFSSADLGDLGLVVIPFGVLTLTMEAGKWKFEINFTADIEAFAYGRHGLTLIASPDKTQIGGSISATLAAPEEGPAFVFGAPNGSRLEVGGAQLKIETALSEAQQSLALSADVSSSAIVIAPGDGDGFLSSILPAEGLQAKFDLGLTWSNERGLAFRGAGSLDATLSVGLSIRDVLTVPTIHLSLRAEDTGLDAEISASVGVSLGPVHAVVDRVGIAAAVTFPEAGGNLGVADLDFHFKTPTGIGLVIDAPTVLGGGYLFFNEQQEEYGGILQLEIAETIAVKAIGLLTTRLPDGSKGFSLVVIIAAEDFPPIQLGFGFTLTGIGGLLGVNRTVMVDVLRSGLKNGTLGSILFPDDPVRNAPQIVSDLRAVFPPVKDRHVFGPMARIAWGGTPPILTLELGLILELPEPVRLIILGRLQAVLPNEDHALIQVRMDAIGVIDFNKGEVSLDATLYDSRILQFVLTGDMALRANWGDQPAFVLAIGGFNPRFPAPAGFPQLARLALSLGDSDNPRLRFESYLALTSNTVQFGARLDFSYTAGLTLAGFLGFDALFQFDPFQFIADVGAMVTLKRGNTGLMGIFLEMTLAGPTPWHIRGTATFKVLFFKVSIHFDHRFGQDEPSALPGPIDVLTLLAEALSDRRNWSSALPRGEYPIVSLQDSVATQTSLRVHPLAELTVRQRIVPLNRRVTKFGHAPLAGGPTTFTLTALGINNTPLHMPSTPVHEAFALGQFEEMSDDEKLTQPSFATQEAGLQFGVEEAAYQYEALLDTAIDYETLLITDPTRPAEKVAEPYVLPQTSLDVVVSLGAAGQAVIRHGGSSRYGMLEQAA